MTPFEMFILIWLSGLTGSALLCDVLPRIYRCMNKAEKRVRKLGEMSDGWGTRWQ